MNIKQRILAPRPYVAITNFPSLLVIINGLASLWPVHPNQVYMKSGVVAQLGA